MWGLTRHLFGAQFRAASTATVRRQCSGFHSVNLCSRRLCSTTLMEQIVINASRWNDSNYYHRLGFCEEVRDLQRIKEHYRILAKHYHPDNPNAPHNATAAFQNIKEAYEHVTAKAKETQNRTQDPISGFRFSDHARRKEQMRFLGDGVGLFMVMTLLFIYIVSKHNKERLRLRYLWDLLLIFFIIQLFPRLLAAAILFACHSNCLVSLTEAQEQAATSVIVERPKDGELCISLKGIKEEVKDNIIMQVTIMMVMAPSANQQISESSVLASSEVTESGDASALSTSTTLTFDSGVTSVLVPVYPGKLTEYRVKAVDMTRGFVLTDCSLQL